MESQDIDIKMCIKKQINFNFLTKSASRSLTVLLFITMINT